MREAECTAFLPWALPRLGMRWTGFRRVRVQVCKRVARRIAELSLKDLAGYRGRLGTGPTGVDAARRPVPDQHLAFLSRPWGLALPGAEDTAGVDHAGTSPRPAMAADLERRLRERRGALFPDAFVCVSEVLEDTRAQILATDADFTLLERARRGCYPGTSLRDLPEAWRAAFAQSGDRHCLRPQYRRSVRFLEQDIRRSYPEGRFDLILCRNLAFTYFEPALRMAIGRCLTTLLGILHGQLTL